MFRARRSKSRGASAVELALVLPLFLLAIFGILDFGRYFFDVHTLQFATRQGARLALVGGRLTDAGGNVMTREASIVETIRKRAAVAVDTTRLSIYIFPVGSDYSDPGGWEGSPPNAGQPGAYMRVRTRYNFRFLTPLISQLFSGGQLLIEAQGTYRNELFDT
jgi:hypothetical protein